MKARIPLLLLVLACLAPRPASALTDEEVFRTFRFNFVNPGGRAGAMGGAFIGIADDATAAAANPAGLTNLLAAELFTELRLENADATSIAGEVRDPRGGPMVLVTRSQGDPDAMLFPSFISFVKPFKKWTLAFSRQELLNTDLRATNLFTDEPAFPPTEIVRADGQLEALVDQYNVSGAFKAGDKFAFGATLSYARMNIESRTDNQFNFGTKLDDDYATAMDDEDEDVTISAGILVHPHERFHIGVVYRAGPKFEVEEHILDTRPPGNYPSAPILADFLGNRNLSVGVGHPFNINPTTFDDPMSFTNTFKLPDQAGIGFGWQPTDRLTLALDFTWVEFSDLEEGMVGNVNALTFPGDPFICDFGAPKADGSFPCEYATPVAKYKIDDELIYRLGIEYAWNIKEKLPFLLRGGFYNDPNVRLQADFGPGGVFIADNPTFPDGNGATHYTIGFGFLAKEKLQMDFAADLSKLANTYIASVIYHF